MIYAALIVWAVGATIAAFGNNADYHRAQSLAEELVEANRKLRRGRYE